ncbi:MAG: ABC transporter ATP-binding protein [Staphylococcus sp.]|nr:ABC transporter ATP-binding protein [Staphylococcus sp.]
MDKYLLEIKDLETSIKIENKWYPTIDQISLNLEKNEILGVVGESGCGKSILNKSVIRLLPDRISKITNGKVIFDSKDLTKITEKEYQNIRGKEIGMIFQEPMTALNPVFKIKEQIIEPIILHLKKNKKEAYQLAKQLLEDVGIARVEEVLNSYPHQLSGGMRQRVMIAIAISCNPKLLIADEPTTALDVTVQAQILSLIKKLQKETELSVALVSHDFGVIAGMCDYVYIMFRGRVVEKGNVEEIFSNAQHPYTKQLLAAARLENTNKELLTVDYKEDDKHYTWQKLSDTHEYLKEVE